MGEKHFGEAFLGVLLLKRLLTFSKRSPHKLMFSFSGPPDNQQAKGLERP